MNFKKFLRITFSKMVAKLVVTTITKGQYFLAKREAVLLKDTQSMVASLKGAIVFLF